MELAFQPQEIQDILYELQDQPDPRIHVVRMGDPENPEPYSMKLSEYDDDEPLDPLAIAKKVRTVLVLCDAQRGVGATQTYCSTIQKTHRKLEVVVRVTEAPKNPDRGVMLAQLLLSSGASKVIVCGMMFDRSGGARTGQAAARSLTIESAEGTTAFGCYGGGRD
mmetsp:Transcript_104107/g.335665  ORF Transcript_104107/g.335665 Transcript_104107/m.335665 type:complete len:165 (-) Transcript_104107:22-516(-)